MEWQLRHEVAFQRDGEMLKKNGNLPKIWENPVYPQSRFIWLWDAFIELETTRISAMDIGRISINSIYEYCRNIGYGREETDFLKCVLLKVDLLYITLSKKITDDKSKKDKRQNVKKRKFGA